MERRHGTGVKFEALCTLRVAHKILETGALVFARMHLPAALNLVLGRVYDEQGFLVLEVLYKVIPLT